MKTAIINTTIILPDYMIPNGTIVIEDGVIVDFGKKICTDGMECIDAKGAYTGPGLIDIHTHADGETFFTEDPERLPRLFLRTVLQTFCLPFTSARTQSSSLSK